MQESFQTAASPRPGSKITPRFYTSLFDIFFGELKETVDFSIVPHLLKLHASIRDRCFAGCLSISIHNKKSTKLQTFFY